MARIRVTFEADLPADANYEDTLEWVNFELGAIGGMSNSPLSTYDLEAIRSTVTIEEL